MQWADEERVQLLMTILDRKTQVQSLMTFSRQNVTPTKWESSMSQPRARLLITGRPKGGQDAC